MPSSHGAAGRKPSLASALRTCLALAALAPAVLGLAGTQPAAGVESWSVLAGEVRARCRMTVGGSFDAVTADVSGTLWGAAPGASAFTGEVRIDLTTLDTGIELRNEHLRSSYLELDRGPEFRDAVLSGIVLDEPPPAGDSRLETRFSGTLTLHGVQRAVEGEAELYWRDRRMQVEAEFSLSLDAFDIPPPRYLGIGVRDEIGISIALEAAEYELPTGGLR